MATKLNTKLNSSEWQKKILKTLNDPTPSPTQGTIKDTWDFAGGDKGIHDTVVGALKSLDTDKFVKLKKVQLKYYELTAESEKYLKSGSPEYLLYCAVPDDGIAMNELKELFVQKGQKMTFNIGFGKAKGLKLIKMKGANVVQTKPDLTDVTVEKLMQLEAKGTANGNLLPAKELKVLKKRKLVTMITRTSFHVSKGENFALDRQKAEATLTKEHLAAAVGAKEGTKAWEKVGSWKGVNVTTFGSPVSGGFLHPLMKVRSEFRKVLLQMGFEEMPTNQWVESSFWNFDALFQPQFHPARDAHDTFFLGKPKGEPEKAHTLPEDYLQRVKDMHENGGGNVGNSSSLGYGYNWSRKEAEKMLLRTHTTAVSARMLYQLGKVCRKEGPQSFEPKKFFSIDRVFRNESMDKTHLCEFHQVEFFIADRGLSLAHLIGLLRTFFKLIGITNLRFKPAYNPYTEPSMEVFGYHPGLKSWTELGNSGIFRPEMLQPMGIPKDVNVIAGGLSLERPTMIKYKYDDIRSMFSNRGDMKANRGKVMARVLDCSGGAVFM